jgi:beta-lactamase regulating signal transducer with metallopeptidase domain
MQARRAAPVSDARWTHALAQASGKLRLSRPVLLLLSDAEVAPATWGLFRPVIILPPSALRLTASQRRAVLVHELSHVKSCDWLFALAARLVCALYWFHPGAWFIAGKLRTECESACDDRVLAFGVRATDYASLLMSSSLRLSAGRQPVALAHSLHGRGKLPQRIQSLLRPGRKVAAPGVAVVAATVFLTLCVAAPTAAAKLAPGRAMLTGLMQDVRWQSRAYAAGRLAQRPDSLALAQSAAALDPSPAVRAWARLALEKQASPPTPTGFNGAATTPAPRR